MDLLLDKKADAAARSKASGNATALFLACNAGHFGVAGSLLHHLVSRFFRRQPAQLRAHVDAIHLLSGARLID